MVHATIEYIRRKVIVMETIYLSGGCFWGVEAFLKRLYGVENTCCGYANSWKSSPTYQEVCSGAYGAVECVKVSYDKTKLSLSQLLCAFSAIIDPTSVNKQGEDTGIQYRTGIYYVNKQDQPIINDHINKLQASYTKQIVTEVKPLQNFYPAEDYHQNYLDINPNGYCHLNLPKAYETVHDMGIKLKEKESE